MVVELHRVVALIGGFPALAGVCLELERGETVLLRGANGAGKSTLLHVCAGLRRPASGTAKVLGCDLTDNRAEVRGRVGLIGHDTGLYGRLTAGENLRLRARAARVDGHAAAVPYAFERVGIQRGLQDIPVARLSAGQRRRVALAAIIMRRPELWLLDEPYSGLDLRSRELLSDVVSEAADSGAAVLVASHGTGAAVGLGARIVRMAAGTAGCDAHSLGGQRG